ncbi:glutathione S-transferase family protein [Planktotalea sp.]|uniref:glutathione S-transferase family protein n=1 Tax=Planktotalea sp. TaxID=2029877 RepID=UPI00329A35A6
MLRIWGRASSSNVQALMWMVGELSLPYERRDAGFTYGGLDTPEFAALNPNRTIPVLQDATNPPIWETGAILRYLAHTYADETFWPTDPFERARVDQWAEWAKINVALNFTAPLFWRVARTAPALHDKQAIRLATEKLSAVLRIAEQQLAKSKWLASDHFTLADIQFGHVLYRYYDIEIERTDLPNLRAYYDRLSARPAFQEHVAISYEELRVLD